MKLLIRRYRPSDKDTVLHLFSVGINEHIGSVVLPGFWVGVVYFCCHEVYAGFVREKLRTDMQDIPGNYLSRLDDCFWVAEAEVDGRTQIMGMVAVVANKVGKKDTGNCSG
ncbi:hypothetical protein KUCAC02_030043 [Chaenocephalus aceratus]|uniref:Uncharacterized protein n=1 Tax=Chaenocephalus aceratus TaxID=36190 RepID=A0ACB9XHL6_CHAAC|nr:hypothetical protein KUCAC02_030043 [Chaenocephalus aceratus]